MKSQSSNIIVFQDAKSPYWFCQYTGPDGVRRKKTTKVPIVGGMFQGEKLTRNQAKSRALIIAHQMAEAKSLEYAEKDNRSTREIFELMMNGKLGRVSTATYNNAQTSYKYFLKWLGKRADAPMRLITKADIKEWVIHRRNEVRAATCRKDLSAIRAAFTWAEDAEIITRNPCNNVRVSADSRDEKIVHDAFTLEEVHLLINKLPDEWASAVRCCIGTFGQRLGDIRHLKWEQFDFTARTVTIITGKTARPLCQPMQEWFYAWAQEKHRQAQEAGGETAVWVLPRLHRHSNPSPEFTALVRAFGIGLSGENAGGNRRVWHSKTFHSLRATVATLLQSAGVSQGMAMQLVGHDSADIHTVYIRPSAEQLRAAANLLPSPQQPTTANHRLI